MRQNAFFTERFYLHQNVPVRLGGGTGSFEGAGKISLYKR
jgi:hypothetical protein